MNTNQLTYILQQDLLVNVLEYSEDIGKCAVYITQQLREIVGTRVVALFERLPSGEMSLAGICPERRKDLLDNPAMQRLIKVTTDCTEPSFIVPGEKEGGAILAELDMSTSFVIPLKTRKETQGMILLLDIMDKKGIGQILESLKSISGLLSLILRNSFLYRNLEILVEKRTKELKESSRFNRLIIDNAHEGIVVYDRHMQCLVWNPFMEAISGTKAIDVVGRYPQEIFPFLKDSGVIESLNRAMAGEDANPLEIPITANGKTDWIIITSTPMRNDKGEIIGVISTVQDVTERKQVAEAFQHAQKLESLGVLAGGIAHDFNNLLGGIFGYIDLAREHFKDEKESGYLVKALETMDRARALTLQLLTFAKGGAPIQTVEHLFPFVKNTARFVLSGSNVSCAFTIPQDLWPSNIDKNQIGQVIDNMVINAKQAMPQGGTLQISANNIVYTEKQHPVLPTGSYVKISIRDHGIGIQKEFLQRIFDPFYTTKSTGHGLGLATSYSIVNRHGGCIDVESEPGIGSTFHIFLPACIDELPPVLEPVKQLHTGSGTFLVMDDELVIRDILSGMLTNFGYTVVCTENGQDALDYISQEITNHHVVSGMIFDLTIPGGMGGKEAIGHIRKLGVKTPAFVSSGYAEDPVMANPAEYGFSASICKPFTRTELAEMLKMHIPV